MSKPVILSDEEDDDEQQFYESHDRLLSLSSSCSCSNSNSDQEQEQEENQETNNNNNTCNYNFALNGYDIWISTPSSVSERRTRLLQTIGLSSDPSLSRGNPLPNNAMFRSKSDGYTPTRSCSHNNNNSISIINTSPSCSSLSLHSATSSVNNGIPGNCGGSPGKPPSGKNSSRRSQSSADFGAGTSAAAETTETVVLDEVECDEVEGKNEKACTIRDLDNGKEFVVKEVREDGIWNKVKEVGTGRQLTMEEFEMTVGHSPIVQELMRRQNVEEAANAKESVDSNGGVGNGSGNGNSKGKKKGVGWLKSIKSVASSMAGHKERRSSDERDTSSEKGGRRSSSATDDSQDATFHGPERVRVRQYGKSCKELTALYKSQEIQAHNGSIWTIKFSLDGKYLASAGEDCVIHVWQVVESERKGELLLMEKQEDINVNMLFLVNGSPEPVLLSPLVDNLPERKRKGRSSISRKSLSLDQFVVPETVFALAEKPICSFQGHLHDVMDLSWSKSQVS